MANDIKSAELCLNAVQALEDQLRGARKTLINSETCIVNRGIMTAQLEYLRDNLPQTVEMAAKIVSEEETIRSETEQKRREILESANMTAQNTLNESSQKAQAMMEQANAEANALMDRASQEAKGCVEAAKGDPIRYTQEQEGRPQNIKENVAWEYLNGNKRCISLNTKTEEGKEALFKLLEGADVLLTNWRLAALERAGLEDRL